MSYFAYEIGKDNVTTRLYVMLHERHVIMINYNKFMVRNCKQQVQFDTQKCNINTTQTSILKLDLDMTCNHLDVPRVIIINVDVNNKVM